MMMKPLVVLLLLLGALVSETRAQSCDPVVNLMLKVNVCLGPLGVGVGVDSTHSILASLSLPPTHIPIPQVPVRPSTPHAPTPPPSSPPAPAHPPCSPSPKAPPPSTPQPPASPPSTPRPPAPSPPPSSPPAPAHPPSSPSPKAPPPSTPQPPASPPSTPRPPAPSPPPSTPQAPPPQPPSICCQQVRNMAAASPTTMCRCLRGLIQVDIIVQKVLLSCGISLGVDLCVNL